MNVLHAAKRTQVVVAIVEVASINATCRIALIQRYSSSSLSSGASVGLSNSIR